MKSAVVQACVFSIPSVLTHTMAERGIKMLQEDLAKTIILIFISTPECFCHQLPAYFIVMIFDGCAKSVISDPVSAMTSPVAEFFGERLATCK